MDVETSIKSEYSGHIVFLFFLRYLNNGLGIIFLVLVSLFESVVSGSCSFRVQEFAVPVIGSLIPRLSNRQAGEPGISRIMNARQFQTRVAPKPQNGVILTRNDEK